MWSDRKFYEEREKAKRMNPVWHGVGCILIAILGTVAYFFSGWFIEQGIVYIPREAMRPSFARFLPDGVFVQIVISILFMMLCYTILSIIWAVIFPKKPKETDAPPVKRKGGPKRRR
jgi:amino acid transporter